MKTASKRGVVLKSLFSTRKGAASRMKEKIAECTYPDGHRYMKVSFNKAIKTESLEQLESVAKEMLDQSTRVARRALNEKGYAVKMKTELDYIRVTNGGRYIAHGSVTAHIN